MENKKDQSKRRTTIYIDENRGRADSLLHNIFNYDLSMMKENCQPRHNFVDHEVSKTNVKNILPRENTGKRRSQNIKKGFTNKSKTIPISQNSTTFSPKSQLLTESHLYTEHTTNLRNGNDKVKKLDNCSWSASVKNNFKLKSKVLEPPNQMPTRVLDFNENQKTKGKNDNYYDLENSKTFGFEDDYSDLDYDEEEVEEYMDYDAYDTKKRTPKVVAEYASLGPPNVLGCGKRSAMQAFVPSTMEDRLGNVIQLGKLYKIKTFHVKEYGQQDKYRPVQIDRQIIFTIDTKVKEIDENEIFIPKNMFDLFKFADLKNMATQQVYLADVIGIIPKKEKLNNFTNSVGKQQVKNKFKLSDDKSRINVTFWDAFAKNFLNAMSEDLEEPLILIIASAKISSWRDQIDVCNYSPTKFYLNYDHHSVQKLRKMFNISVVASNASGEIQVLIKDKEIRSLLGTDFESIEEKDYTFKLRIKEDNINWKDKVYDAIDIFLDFELDEEMVQEQETFTDKEPMTGEPSGSSYHIDQISQFSNM
ncbi:hypothetical protein POM88_046698 [Heracleum sosnowskyi]|uniref:Uncharacterized protein n=1 Tax=Heracleum sosnowskyi TaxID=360622 RepID=A0AAD8M753_9APIA|nr:hypothetical protein POM88_046698 [Heracleum sosnowskyi]